MRWPRAPAAGPRRTPRPRGARAAPAAGRAHRDARHVHVTVRDHLLVGADVVMTASALLRHGVGHAGVLLDGLSGWMARKGFATVADARGLLAVPADTDRAAYERAGYVTMMRAANRCHRPW